LDKNNNVLSILTKYLLQYKRVTIPHVGSFQIRSKAAELDVADKKVLAPAFVTEYSGSDAVSEHQYHYIASILEQDRNSVTNEMVQFGQWLKERIVSDTFKWNGLGTLKNRRGEIVFEAEQMQIPSLGTIAAGKVIRENASHTVLVGEREHSSEEMTERLQVVHPETKKSHLHLIGWIVLVLAILAIIYFVYAGSFSSLSSGSGWK
jgi:hypothetical protein